MLGNAPIENSYVFLLNNVELKPVYLTLGLSTLLGDVKIANLFPQMALHRLDVSAQWN